MMRPYDEYHGTCITPDTICCFDIETTSYYYIDGDITAYRDDIDSETYNAAPKGAVCYIWQFAIDDVVYYGRDLADFPRFLKKLNFLGAPIIWVHNLAYEMQFLRGVMSITDVFARTVRKPIKLIADGLEFRCTYMLTRLSLAAWGAQIGVNKKTGDLDYNKLRTPLTPLTAAEIGYCEVDVLVMYAGLKIYRDKYGSLQDIPLTQTGEIRKIIKKMYADNTAYKHFVTKLQPATVDDYKTLRAAFGGGDTHANYMHAGKVLHDVGSYDLTSDYPSQMCKRKYPMSAFKKVRPDIRGINPDKYAYLISAVLYNVKSITPCRYIARSRCVTICGGTYDNGRVITANKICIVCTEQDYSIIQQTYVIGRVEIRQMRRSVKQYLQPDFIKLILQLYKNKTALKGISDKHDIYMQAKQYINSMYGMCVTDILQPDIDYMCNGWIDRDNGITPKQLAAKQKKALDDIQCKFYKNTLAYQWGVWVTAYARRQLWDIIIAIGDDVVYYDTDSAKILHPRKYTELFAAADKQTAEQLDAMCIYYGIPVSDTTPATKKGVKKPLGAWDYEGTYYEYITLGAKRYAYRNAPKSAGGAVNITVSGVPKSAAKNMRDIYEFCDGYEFDRATCGKQLVYYLDGNNYMPTFADGYTVTNPYAMCLRKNGYRLTLTCEYNTLINAFKSLHNI